MIELAILLALGTLAVGVSAALLLRLLPALRLQLAGARAARRDPAARRRARLRVGDVRDARRHRGPRRLLGGGPLLGARGAAARALDPRAARATACSFRQPRRRRPLVEGVRAGTCRGCRGGPRVQRHGRLDRAAVRGAPRARRVGEPRPAHAARIDAGDDRGDRRRARRARRVHALARRPGPHPLRARRRPVRARADRRRGAYAADAAGRSARR